LAPSRPDLAELAPEARVSLAGELIGAPLTLAPGGGRSAPLEGTIVDESLGTLLVRPAGQRRTLRLAKSGLAGTVRLAGHEIPLKGNLLRVRPEDRTKRLLAGGPRRFR